MMTGNTAIHIASQLQSGAPRKAAFLVAVPRRQSASFCGSRGDRSLRLAIALRLRSPSSSYVSTRGGPRDCYVRA